MPTIASFTISNARRIANAATSASASPSALSGKIATDSAPSPLSADDDLKRLTIGTGLGADQRHEVANSGAVDL